MRLKYGMVVMATMLLVSIGCSDPSFEGRYIKGKRNGEYIELNKDQTFTLKQDNRILSGQYELKGGHIFLQFNDGSTATGKIDDQTLVDPDGIKWTKQ